GCCGIESARRCDGSPRRVDPPYRRRAGRGALARRAGAARPPPARLRELRCGAGESLGAAGGACQVGRRPPRPHRAAARHPGAGSGPGETQLRLLVRSDTLEFAALLGVSPEPDSVVLAADVFTRRLAGRSRRGLPLWEEDAYRRAVRLAWGDTARLYPGGPPARRPPGQWIEVVVATAAVGGATRPTEEAAVTEEAPEFIVEAVARPRRVIAAVLLVRGDTVSAPASFDLVVEGPARRITLRRRPLELALARPEPATAGPDRVLARDVDAVCLRVTDAGATEAARVL